MSVARLRPILSVMAPLSNVQKTWQTKPMLVISPIWPSSSPSANM